MTTSGAALAKHVHNVLSEIGGDGYRWGQMERQREREREREGEREIEAKLM